MTATTCLCRSSPVFRSKIPHQKQGYLETNAKFSRNKRRFPFVESRINDLSPEAQSFYSLDKTSDSNISLESLSPSPQSPDFSPLSETFSLNAVAKVLVLVPEGIASPLGDGVPWKDVFQHMAQRIDWIQAGVETLVYTSETACDDSGNWTVNFKSSLESADIFFSVDFEGQNWIQRVGSCMEAVETSVYFGPSQQLSSLIRLGGLAIGQLSPVERAAVKVGLWPKASESFKLMDLLSEVWSRMHPDDVWFSILVLVNSQVTPIEALNNLRAQDLESLKCMTSNCGPQILECLKDPNCRAAIGCLTSCGPTDQICSYRCIVSYESPALEAFSLCTLQKHNCLRLNAPIREFPQVQPMDSFRGQTLTHDLAVDLFVGWLGKEEFSWRVVAGQNAAYDQFPCQFQIFYRGKGKSTVWYDPVFKVKTLDGRTVWRRRHYRVKTSEVPGTFWFSVLDNGVVSKEFWRIVDVDDEFNWGLFYYSGAASVAGQSYTGAVFVSKDGNWPEERHHQRIKLALEKCGIKPWELFSVDNSSCSSAPLGLPDDIPSPVSIV